MAVQRQPLAWVRKFDYNPSDIIYFSRVVENWIKLKIVKRFIRKYDIKISICVKVDWCELV